MPRIIVTVHQDDKRLWVEAAHAELVTLSEWIRRAATERLDTTSTAIQNTANTRLGAGVKVPAAPKPAETPKAQTKPPAGVDEPTAPAPSRALPAHQHTTQLTPGTWPGAPPERQFTPDFKDEPKPKKGRR